MQVNYGGKANSLIKLKNNNFNVPNFFIVSVNDFKSFLDFNNIKETITILFNNKEYEKISNIIMSSSFPEEIHTFIVNKWKSLESNFVSVRSSAVNEDGKLKSFAGQYETILNVTFNNLFESIKKCWCSLYSENVIEYTSNKNLFGMNIIIQQMIEPDYAGVAFSKDVFSSTGNYSIIEIVKGCGDKLVSGQVTPVKFLVRRQTLHIDLKIGKINLNENIIVNLQKLLLEVEALYKRPIDIEFAIKNDEIFLLQARPITVSEIKSIPFSLSISRPKTIIEEEINFIGEYSGIKKLTRGLYYLKPLFMYNKTNNNVDMFYNWYDLEEDPKMIFYYMDLDYEDIKLYYEKVKTFVSYLNDVIDNKKDINIEEFINNIIFIYPFSSLGQLVGHFENVTDRLKEILFDFRNKYDYIVHKATDYLHDILQKSLPNNLKQYSDFITLDEFKTKNFPSVNALKRRKQGYIYFEKLCVTNNYNSWLKKNNIFIKEDNSSSFLGQTAYPGVVKGHVCKIFSDKDFNSFNKGDILVAPMILPKYVKIMKLAGAIVTDEGGLTCHACIVSREFKIPCVVGCKNITKILNNGDLIEVNADAGEIKLLN